MHPMAIAKTMPASATAAQRRSGLCGDDTRKRAGRKREARAGTPLNCPNYFVFAKKVHRGDRIVKIRKFERRFPVSFRNKDAEGRAATRSSHVTDHQPSKRDANSCCPPFWMPRRCTPRRRRAYDPAARAAQALHASPSHRISDCAGAALACCHDRVRAGTKSNARPAEDMVGDK